MAGRRRRDLLDIIEAAYSLEPSDDEWLARVAESVYRSLPFKSVGVIVNGYDISDPARPELIRGFQCAGPDLRRMQEGWQRLVPIFTSDPDRTRASYGSLDEGLGLEIPVPGSERLAAAFRSMRMGDVYGVNGRNPSGKGVFVGIAMPLEFQPIPPSTRRTFARIARHLAAAHRLRTRLAESNERAARADAWLRADGTIEHAVDEAKARDAREALRRAVVTVAAARGQRRETDPERAIATWKALVDARWSLVDHFERGGSHYLVAHRNDCAPAPVALLTDRERQVAVLAAMGHSNKSIAYDLGIATSTVGVLVSRALQRLGLRSRRELRALFTRP